MRLTGSSAWFAANVPTLRCKALVTLNDPVYFEAAQALGRRMAASAGTTAEKVPVGIPSMSQSNAQQD
jgi:hypothetical protein